MLCVCICVSLLAALRRVINNDDDDSFDFKLFVHSKPLDGDGSCNTIEENSSIFSIIRNR